MRFVFRYTERARRDLQQLDRKIAQRIVRKVRLLSSTENPLVFAAPLQGDFVRLYRFRIGDYRIIVKVTKEGAIMILLILRIGHRRDIYRLST